MTIERCKILQLHLKFSPFEKQGESAAFLRPSPCGMFGVIGTPTRRVRHLQAQKNAFQKNLKGAKSGGRFVLQDSGEL
jgi:hypothetical protein